MEDVFLAVSYAMESNSVLMAQMRLAVGVSKNQLKKRKKTVITCACCWSMGRYFVMNHQLKFILLPIKMRGLQHLLLLSDRCCARAATFTVLKIILKAPYALLLCI